MSLKDTCLNKIREQPVTVTAANKTVNRRKHINRTLQFCAIMHDDPEKANMIDALAIDPEHYPSNVRISSPYAEIPTALKPLLADSYRIGRRMNEHLHPYNPALEENIQYAPSLCENNLGQNGY